MQHRKSVLDEISERKQNYNKSARPKHNRRSTQLPSQNRITVAQKIIYKTSPETNKRPTVAQWNEECEKKKRIVRAEYRKHHRDPTNTIKLRAFQRRKVVKQRVFRKTRQDTWNKFVNSTLKMGVVQK